MKQLLGLFILSIFLLSFISVADAAYGRENSNTDRIQERKVDCAALGMKRCPDGTLVGPNPKNNCLYDCPNQDKKTFNERILKMQERLAAAQTRKDELKDSTDLLKSSQCRMKCSGDQKCIGQAINEGNCGAAFTKIKEHLTKTVDRMIEAFTALQTRLSSADTTTPSDQLKTITTALTTLQSLKAEIAAAQTREQLKAVMTKVRETWVMYKQSFKERKTDAYQQRAASLLQKAERIQLILKQALSRIKTNDADASQASAIEATLQAIDTQIASVRQALSQGDKTVIKNSLQKLHDLLQNAIKQFRQAGKGDTIATVTTAEPAPVQGVI